MVTTAIFSLVFLIVGLAAMFLMFRLWGYPFDKATRTSSAPRWAMILHRVLGYAFVLLYVLLMIEMVPRLVHYQVEFPARTVVHIVLAFTLGFLLLIKIAIMRFFRHFEEWMPVLGTSIMLCTVVLLGLSLPFVVQERALARSAPGGDAMSLESLARLEAVLPTANLPKEAPLRELATAMSLAKGRAVLVDQCVHCHDLKTILAKPRDPAGWWDTVDRMAEKPTLFGALAERDQWNVTAYLIAITPDLQKSNRNARAREDPKSVFTRVCTQCHDATDVDKAPPATAVEAAALVQRMIIENDAKLTPEEIESVTRYLTSHYVTKSS